MSRVLQFIVLASIMMLSVLGLEACSTWGIWPGSDPPRQQHQIVIDDNDKMCVSAQDCVLAWTDCSSCECGTPVNKQHAAKVEQTYKAMCTDYRGPVCDMACPEVTLDCVDNLCVAVEKAE